MDSQTEKLKADWAKEERKKKKEERDARIASMDEEEKAAFEKEESERRAAKSLKRKEQRRAGQLPDDKMRQYLKGRATVTSGLLCLVFAAAYGSVMFGGNPP